VTISKTPGVRYDAEAEEAVLGAMLLSRDATTAALEVCDPSDFYVPAHSLIFGAIGSLYDDGRPVDAVTVTDELRKIGALERIGDPSIFVSLQTNTPSISSARHYAEIVQREAVARTLQHGFSEAQKSLSDFADPVVVAEEAERFLGALVRSGKIPRGYWSQAGAYQATDRSETLTPLAEGFCYPLSRIMVVAGEKTGKSVMLRQVAFCIAAGLHPFNPRVKINPVRTLIFDAENDDDELVPTIERIRTMVTVYAGPDAPEPALYSVPYGVDLESRRDRADLYAVLEDCRPQLIIGGPVYKLTDQTQDYSEDRRAAIVQRVCNDIRKRWGTALILEHHAPTGPGRGREIRAKGGQVWPAWVNMTVGLHPSENGDGLDVRYPHRPRGLFSWPKRFDRGMVNGWPWLPVMRSPVLDVQPTLDEQDYGDEGAWSEPF
jgi:replicative DNA helicase